MFCIHQISSSRVPGSKLYTPLKNVTSTTILHNSSIGVFSLLRQTNHSARMVTNLPLTDLQSQESRPLTNHASGVTYEDEHLHADPNHSKEDTPIRKRVRIVKGPNGRPRGVYRVKVVKTVPNGHSYIDKGNTQPHYSRTESKESSEESHGDKNRKALVPKMEDESVFSERLPPNDVNEYRDTSRSRVEHHEPNSRARYSKVESPVYSKKAQYTQDEEEEGREGPDSTDDNEEPENDEHYQDEEEEDHLPQKKYYPPSREHRYHENEEEESPREEDHSSHSTDEHDDPSTNEEKFRSSHEEHYPPPKELNLSSEEESYSNSKDKYSSAKQRYPPSKEEYPPSKEEYPQLKEHYQPTKEHYPHSKEKQIHPTHNQYPPSRGHYSAQIEQPKPRGHYYRPYVYYQPPKYSFPPVALYPSHPREIYPPPHTYSPALTKEPYPNPPRVHYPPLKNIYPPLHKDHFPSLTKEPYPNPPRVHYPPLKSSYPLPPIEGYDPPVTRHYTAIRKVNPSSKDHGNTAKSKTRKKHIPSSKRKIPAHKKTHYPTPHHVPESFVDQGDIHYGKPHDANQYTITIEHPVHAQGQLQGHHQEPSLGHTPGHHRQEHVVKETYPTVYQPRERDSKEKYESKYETGEEDTKYEKDKPVVKEFPVSYEPEEHDDVEKYPSRYVPNKHDAEDNQEDIKAKHGSHYEPEEQDDRSKYKHDGGSHHHEPDENDVEHYEGRKPHSSHERHEPKRDVPEDDPYQKRHEDKADDHEENDDEHRTKPEPKRKHRYYDEKRKFPLPKPDPAENYNDHKPDFPDSYYPEDLFKETDKSAPDNLKEKESDRYYPNSPESPSEDKYPEEKHPESKPIPSIPALQPHRHYSEELGHARSGGTTHGFTNSNSDHSPWFPMRVNVKHKYDPKNHFYPPSSRSYYYRPTHPHIPYPDPQRHIRPDPPPPNREPKVYYAGANGPVYKSPGYQKLRTYKTTHKKAGKDPYDEDKYREGISEGGATRGYEDNEELEPLRKSYKSTPKPKKSKLITKFKGERRFLSPQGRVPVYVSKPRMVYQPPRMVNNHSRVERRNSDLRRVEPKKDVPGRHASVSFEQFLGRLQKFEHQFH